jgi:hypothetical protein
VVDTEVRKHMPKIPAHVEEVASGSNGGPDTVDEP